MKATEFEYRILEATRRIFKLDSKGKVERITQCWNWQNVAQDHKTLIEALGAVCDEFKSPFDLADWSVRHIQNKENSYTVFRCVYTSDADGQRTTSDDATHSTRIIVAISCITKQATALQQECLSSFNKAKRDAVALARHKTLAAKTNPTRSQLLASLEHLKELWSAVSAVVSGARPETAEQRKQLEELNKFLELFKHVIQGESRLKVLELEKSLTPEIKALILKVPDYAAALSSTLNASDDRSEAGNSHIRKSLIDVMLEIHKL